MLGGNICVVVCSCGIISCYLRPICTQNLSTRVKPQQYIYMYLSSTVRYCMRPYSCPPVYLIGQVDSWIENPALFTHYHSGFAFKDSGCLAHTPAATRTGSPTHPDFHIWKNSAPPACCSSRYRFLLIQARFVSRYVACVWRHSAVTGLRS